VTSPVQSDAQMRRHIGQVSDMTGGKKQSARAGEKRIITLNESLSGAPNLSI